MIKFTYSCTFKRGNSSKDQHQSSFLNVNKTIKMHNAFQMSAQETRYHGDE